jgi:hypothetical protein
LYNVHVLCSVFDYVGTLHVINVKNLNVHFLTSWHAMSFFKMKIKIKESSF